jgi:hypothetical protein
VQPNTSPTSTDGNIFVVTSSQITAIIVGTFVGSAIVTLVIVCFISSCRKKRAAKYAEKQGLDAGGSPNSQDHDESTGRAEGYWSRQEAGTVPTSAALSRPSASTGRAPAAAPAPTPQRPPSVVHRPNLPTLVEESPPVSATLNPSYSARNVPTRSTADGLPYSPPVVNGVPQQPEPVKLALSKRVSRGGSQRTAVVRLGSQEISDNGRLSSGLSISTSQPNDSYFLPGSSRASSQALPNRPSLSRSPSSETLPVLRKTMASPLTLNPPNAAFSAPEIPAIPHWTGPLKSKTPPNAGVDQRQTGSQYGNQESQAQIPQSQRQSQQPDDPFTRAEPQLSHIAFLVSQKHMEEQTQQLQQTSQNTEPESQVKHNMSTSSSVYSGNNVVASNAINTVAAAVNSDTYLATPVPRRVSILPLPPVSPFSESFDGSSQTQTVVVNDPGWAEYPSSLSPPPPPPPRSPLRKSAALSVSNQPPMQSASPPSPSPDKGPGQNDKAAMFSPMPSWRSSRNSFYAPDSYNVAGALGLAQATAGLDIVGGMADGTGSGKGKETVVRVKRGDSNGSNSSTDSNTNANGGRYTWLASTDDVTQEAGNKASTPPPKTTTITSTWAGGGPLMEPSPAEFASAASMRRNERQAGARLTVDGAKFPTPLDLSSATPATPKRESQVEPQTPRFSLFPRTDGGGGSPAWSTANSDVSQVSPVGAGVGIALSRDPSPVDSGSRRASRLGHKRNSSSLSTFNLGRRDRRSSALQIVNK